jgi:hypothetical protein
MTNVVIVGRIRMVPSELGGRILPTPADRYVCQLKLGGEVRDCTVLLDTVGSLRPGQAADVRIAVDTSRDFPFEPSPGAHFTLWEMRTVATGEVMAIEPPPELVIDFA